MKSDLYEGDYYRQNATFLPFLNEQSVLCTHLFNENRSYRKRSSGQTEIAIKLLIKIVETKENLRA